MSESQAKPLLYEYFAQSVAVLLAEYERSRQQMASDNLGANRQAFCDRFLERVLPSRVVVVQGGEIWDSKGHNTGQIDVLVLRDDAAALAFGGTRDTYLVEGVLAAIEVKSNLTSDKLQKALLTLDRVKSLEPSKSETLMQAGAVLERPLRCIFAYEGATWSTTLSAMNDYGPDPIADVVSILTRGALVRSGLLLKWGGGSTYNHIDGQAAALAFLYFHLVTYAAGFMARGMGLAPYYEPVNAWRDDPTG